MGWSMSTAGWIGRWPAVVAVLIAVLVVGVQPVQASHVPGGTYLARVGQDGSGRPVAILQVAAAGNTLETCWIVSLFIANCGGTPIVNHHFTYQPDAAMPPLLVGAFTPNGRANGNFILSGRSGNMVTQLNLMWAGAAGGPGIFCQPGETPEFRFGMAELRATLGEQMGDPIDCEGETSTTLTVQRTTTGIAYFLRERNSPAFTTDGLTRHALTPSGLVTWQGASNAPPEE